METSEAFRASRARHGHDYLDVRIKSVVAIAPATPIRSFVPLSIAELQPPVIILTGGADDEAPSAHCADWLVSLNNRFQHHELGRHVGHYTFLEFPSDKSLIGKVDIFADHESVNRSKIHEQAADIAIQNLRKTVTNGKA